jgi:hypothetical protein
MGVTSIRPARGLKLPWLLRIELLDVRPLVLHEFVINGVRYAEPDPDFAGELKQVDERRVVLSKALGMNALSFDLAPSGRGRGPPPEYEVRSRRSFLHGRRERLPAGGRRWPAWLCQFPRRHLGSAP